MFNDEIVLVEVFCEAYNITSESVSQWHKMGLIELLNEDNKSYLRNDELEKIEKLIKIQTELQVLPADIDIVYNLIEQLKYLQQENNRLRRILNEFD